MPDISWFYRERRIKSPSGPVTGPTLSLSRPRPMKGFVKCVGTNNAGEATDAAYTVFEAPRRPFVHIRRPRAGATFQPGDTVQVQGVAFNGYRKPINTLEWEGVFHHDNHTHPWFDTRTGPPSFEAKIPAEGEPSRHVFYRIRMKATNEWGRASETFRDITPAPLDSGTLDLDLAQLRKGGSIDAWGWRLEPGESVGDLFRFQQSRRYAMRIQARSASAAGSVIEVTVANATWATLDTRSDGTNGTFVVAGNVDAGVAPVLLVAKRNPVIVKTLALAGRCGCARL